MFRIIGVVGLGIFLAASGSKAATPPSAARAETIPTPDNGPSVCDGRRPHGKLVFITIDGVRWQEIFGGTEAGRPGPRLSAVELTPNLHALGARGAFVGAPGHGTISATGPNFISFPGYTEMLSGHAAPCQTNQCPRNIRTTVFDEAWVGGESVGAFMTWQHIDYAITTMEKSFTRSGGDLRTGSEIRTDAETTSAALAYYERERPDVFFFGLGETDTAAHHNDYEEYISKLRDADHMIGELLALTDGDTHVFVTADHGRSYNFRDHVTPDAARVWMVAAGPRIPAHGEVYSPKPRRLADIAPTIRSIIGLRADNTNGAGEVLDEIFQANATKEPSL